MRPVSVWGDPETPQGIQGGYWLAWEGICYTDAFMSELIDPETEL